MDEVLGGSIYKAVVKKIEFHPCTIRLWICYGVNFMGWPRYTVFETVISQVDSSIYAEALKLRRGDEVMADPDENHRISECFHNNWFVRIYNLLSY